MDNPCKTCIVLPLCKSDFKDNNFTSIASMNLHQKCPFLEEYFDISGQDEINELRVLYGLEPLK
jgi:hypothetical protein